MKALSYSVLVVNYLTYHAQQLQRKFCFFCLTSFPGYWSMRGLCFVIEKCCTKLVGFLTLVNP